jgi:hypothetical protein
MVKKEKRGKNHTQQIRETYCTASSLLYPGLNGGSGDYSIAGLAWGRSCRNEGKVAPWQ